VTPPQPIPYQLMEAIRAGIIDGRYPAGQSLREEALEAEFGVSRGPVREALRLLELRGLVTHVPRRGFRVRTYDARTVEDLYALRSALERKAVEALAGRRLDCLVDELEASNARMAARFRERDVAAYLAENVTFHSLILKASGNEPLMRTLAVLNEMAEPLRYRLLSRDLSASRSLEQHKRITIFIARGHIGAAAAATEGHILESLPSLLALVSEKIVDNFSGAA
jgi:DNA-binding GntR family transcriptional regulator